MEKQSTCHLVGPVSRRELRRVFLAGMPPDVEPGWVVALYSRYCDDLAHAALKIDIVWLPALGDVYTSSRAATSTALQEPLLEIIAATPIDYRLIRKPDRRTGAAS